MVHLNLICDHIVAFKRAQDGSHRLSNLRETEVSSCRASLKITFPVISPVSGVAAMIYSHLIRGHIIAFKQAQVCPNQFSHLREKDVSLMEVGLKITFLVISPEPEVAAMIHSHLIRGHISAFKRALVCPNRFSHP